MSFANKHKSVLPFIIAMTLFFMVAGAELVRTAWIADDAAITLRTVLNFIHGYGLTFNLDERVQAYTHPLWFLLISIVTLAIGNVFYATFILSIAISLLVYWLLIKRIAPDWRHGLLATSILLFSKAYVDYSTSGLENPLSHLMLILLVLSGRQALPIPHSHQIYPTLVLCASLYLVRPDLVLMGLPLYVLLLWRNFQSAGKTIRLIIASGIPVIAWILFSLIYYGFPFPNTAYAKLGAGIPLLERLEQGGFYLVESFSRDPVTLAAILTATLWGLCNQGLRRMLAIGNVLYLAYIVSIGGDFMSGRLLTPVLLVSIMLLAGRNIPLDPAFAKQKTTNIPPLPLSFIPKGTWGILLLLALGTANIHSTLLSKSSLLDQNHTRGIADERGYYFQKFGLLTAPAETFQPPEWFPGKRQVVTICGGLGFASIKAGPGVHMIDTCALADPLLARLPAKYNPQWRIGHFFRTLPTNYKTSVLRGRNTLMDPLIRDYYTIIRRITRAPLLDSTRLLDIVRVNLGLLKPDFSYYRFHQEEGVSFTFNGQQSTDVAVLAGTGELRDQVAEAYVALDDPGFLTYGPYLKLAPGSYRLDMTYNSSATTQTTVGTHDIAVSHFGEVNVLEERVLKGTDGQSVTLGTTFQIPQDADIANNLYEFRTHWNGTADMRVSTINLHTLPY